MSQVQKPNFKIGAQIVLISLLLFIVLNIITIFQVKHQLISDFIPQTLVWDITKINVIIAVTLGAILLISLLLYFYKKYKLIIILGVATLILQETYKYFN